MAGPHLPRASAATRSNPPLSAQLASRAKPGTLFTPARDGAVRCDACAHRCVIAEGKAGACDVRFVRDGVLHVPHGYVARSYVRSVETNTIFHVRPGAAALTFGMYGCDLRCPYCHNWKVSQALRDGVEGESPRDVTANELASEAVAANCAVVCAAYNEPMISAEWVREVFAAAKRRGLITALISDGNSTPEALAFMRDVTDVFRVDFKAESTDAYRTLGGRPAPVIASIESARRMGYWVEVVTLVVPGFNDAPNSLRSMAKTLASIDPEIPWHLNAFHPRYKLADHPGTPGYPLIAAAGAAYAHGVKYVYVGNVAAEVRELSHTRCTGCTAVLVERHGYQTLAVHLRAGACAACGTRVPGLWSPVAGASAPFAVRGDGEMP